MRVHEHLNTCATADRSGRVIESTVHVRGAAEYIGINLAGRPGDAGYPRRRLPFRLPAATCYYLLARSQVLFRLIRPVSVRSMAAILGDPTTEQK